MQVKARWRIGILSFALTLSTAGAAGTADERKQLAFDVIERNAQQMTDISDSIYYFGEIGMQEFEGSKLLKETLEAAGFRVELGGDPRQHHDGILHEGRGPARCDVGRFCF